MPRNLVPESLVYLLLSLSPRGVYILRLIDVYSWRLFAKRQSSLTRPSATTRRVVSMRYCFPARIVFYLSLTRSLCEHKSCRIQTSHTMTTVYGQCICASSVEEHSNDYCRLTECLNRPHIGEMINMMASNDMLSADWLIETRRSKFHSCQISIIDARITSLLSKLPLWLIAWFFYYEILLEAHAA